MYWSLPYQMFSLSLSCSLCRFKYNENKGQREELPPWWEKVHMEEGGLSVFLDRRLSFMQNAIEITQTVA
jgi:hypothetical protein